MTRTSAELRIQAIPRPERMLSKADEAALTERQLELLDQLPALFDKGFAHLRMAEIAREMNCSLRTLYGLAPSREKLVLIVVERSLWSIGRAARSALSAATTGDAAGEATRPLEMIRAYLTAANMAVADTTHEFARDISEVSGGHELWEAHSDYLVAVTRELLDIAVEQGEIAPVDTAAAARVVAGLGRDFAQPHVLRSIASSPKRAADMMVDVILRGLTTVPAAG